MTIRQATDADIDAVERGYTELLTHEKEHGSNSNWVLGLYPTRAVAEKGLVLKTLYVLEDAGTVRASMVLNGEEAEEYRRIPWPYPAGPGEVLVIHTLCIPPSGARRGFGKAMVEFAIRRAEETGCRVLRIDTWAENKPAISFYGKLVFRLAGKTDILLQVLIPEEQVFLERKVSG